MFVKKICFSVLAGVLFCTATYAQSQTPVKEPPAETSQSTEAQSDSILTPKQKKQIHALRVEGREAMKTAMNNLHTQLEGFRKAFSSVNTDDDVQKAHENLIEARRKIEDLQYQFMMKVRALLSPEQRDAFLKRMKHHMTSEGDAQRTPALDKSNSVNGK